MDSEGLQSRYQSSLRFLGSWWFIQLSSMLMMLCFWGLDERLTSKLRVWERWWAEMFEADGPSNWPWYPKSKCTIFWLSSLTQFQARWASAAKDFSRRRHSSSRWESVRLFWQWFWFLRFHQPCTQWQFRQFCWLGVKGIGQKFRQKQWVSRFWQFFKVWFW